MKRLKFSDNPAIQALIRSKRTGTQASSTVSTVDLEKYQEEPSIKARKALDQLFHRALGFQANSYVAAQTYEPIEGGDPAAVQEYARIVCEHVENLNSLIGSHREMLLPLSRKRISWPVRIVRGKMFRKMFGEDPGTIIRELELGKETIAGDPKARFNLNKRFGKVAWELIQRIERRRVTPLESLHFSDALSNTHCSWTEEAQKLPPFSRGASPKEQRQWLAVVKRVLADDFTDHKKSASYRCLITAPAHKKRPLESLFFDKISGEFDSLWGLNRKPKG